VEAERATRDTPAKSAAGGKDQAAAKTPVLASPLKSAPEQPDDDY
jgi:hypothetical protein